VIGGKNKAGKTSALKSIEYALGGKKAIPSRPLRTGAKSGKIRLELECDEVDTQELHQTGLIVEREFFEDGRTEMRLTSADGFEAPQPQRLLDDFYSKSTFDPRRFLTLEPDKKRDELRRMVGLDFTAQDKLHKTLYDQRTMVNNQGKALKSRVDAMPSHADAPPEEIKLPELMAEWANLKDQNSANAKSRTVLDSAKRANTILAQKVTDATKEVAELERRLQTAKHNLAGCESAFDQDTAMFGVMQQEVAALQDADTASVELQLKEADAKNRKLRENNDKIKAASDLRAMRDKSQSLTDEMTKIDADKQTAMQQANWPVPGLGFSEDGITLNGLPFEQASDSEQLETSLAMGAAQNPKLRMMMIRDGSLCDDEARNRIELWAIEHDYLVLMEVVTRTEADEGECCVVIVDGHVKDTQGSLINDSQTSGTSTGHNIRGSDRGSGEAQENAGEAAGQ